MQEYAVKVGPDQIDPTRAAQRIAVMMIAREQKLAPAHASVAMRDLARLCEVHSVQDPTEIAYSEQTCWMLAVRDQRDKAAFKNLFGFFAPRLKGMLMRNGTPGAQAEEIVQEVLLTVWQKSAQFDPQRAEASGWIYRIARNRMIDVARKERRPVPEELMIEEPPAEDPAQIMALEQEMSRLRKALAELPPKQRAMVERAYMGELTHQEIEASTGLPLGTIKSRIRLGLDRLRHELRELRDK